MSEATTPSSGSRTPASFQSSRRTSYSDTTPSPSGGNRSPSFNPRKLSNKLALLEASESLAYAAETLSVAAKAMSKAAASLAASGYQDDECEYEAREFKARKTYASRDLIASSDWTRASYMLPPPATTHGEGTYTPDEGYVLGATPSSKEPEVSLGSMQTTPETLGLVDPIGTLQGDSGKSSASPQDQTPALLTSIPSLPVQNKPSTTPVANINSVTPARPAPAQSAQPAQPAIGQGIASANASPIMAPSNRTTITTPKPAPQAMAAKPAAIRAPSTSISAPNTSNVSARQLSRIVLDRGFDSLLALCDISKRCAKTVCFYPNPGASTIHTVGAVLKAHTSQGVIIPDSLKPEKLLVAAQKFSSASSGVLVWPSHIVLTDVTNLESPNTQIIFLGEPLKETADVICPRITMILAKSEWTKLNTNAAKSINQKYYTDPLTNAYNDQEAGSPLHPLRKWMRRRLSDVSFSRSFYWGWIVHHRKQNPSWTALQLVEAANKYAEEFLLRGDNRSYGEPIGGHIPVSRSDAQGQRLQPAVQAGILLVY